MPHHFDAACALYGAEDLGIRWKLVELKTLKNFELLARTQRIVTFVGSAEFMREVFTMAGVETPKLPRNSNRPFHIITLDEARSLTLPGKLKLFVKPVETKVFTGFVMDEFQNRSIANVPGETKVMVYAPFPSKILSEWRIYVHQHKIVDTRNYAGSYLFNPDYTFVGKVVDENRKDFPVAYTVDVAIFEKGVNEVVEFNDFWAIGNYGIPNDLYLNMLRDRYRQIVYKEQF